MTLKEKIDKMTDEELNAFLHEIYTDEAKRYNKTVDELFDMSVLRNWFRAGFPGKVAGMDNEMLRLAMIPLIDKGYFD